MATDIAIRIVTLNNKSRKGDYVSVKRPGKRISYHKLYEDIPFDLYALAGKDNGTVTQLRTAYLEEQRNNALRPRTSRRRAFLRAYASAVGTSLSGSLAAGASRVSVMLSDLNTATVRGIERRLLEPLVLDKDLLPLVQKNLHKMRHRFHYETSLLGQDKRSGARGVTLAVIKDYGKRTPSEYLQQYLESGHSVALPGTVIDYKWRTSVAKYLRIPELLVVHNTEGTISNGTVHITFLKGRGGF